ncbi:hypothetical protein BD626DRAFT_570249 [Schizophyllum amplum]|uniref:F-box domain-containing protein n=1 Tax=Schizophyllum amplum TaxID=97359 RepID=A0A550CB48_9AGAR|nr:hypothetical protein BD626DRAFT_570249 [Auriculariopsis ampla]
MSLLRPSVTAELQRLGIPEQPPPGAPLLPPVIPRGTHLIELPPLSPSTSSAQSTTNPARPTSTAQHEVPYFSSSSAAPAVSPVASSDSPGAEGDVLLLEHVPPINRLPVELLAEIFFHTLPSPDVFWSSAFTSSWYGNTFRFRRGPIASATSEAAAFVSVPTPPIPLGLPADMVVPSPMFLPSPMVLTAVCAYWRAVAIGTPMLWNRIIAGKLDAPCQLRWAELQVARSNDLPLVIRVRASSKEACVVARDACAEAHDAALFDGMLRVLLPHARRWREVVLDISNLTEASTSMRLFPALADFPETAALQLESAALLRYGGQQQGSCIEFWNWAMSSPNMRRVTLDSGYDFLLRPDEAPAAWDQIQAVNLWNRDVGLLELLNLLRACPRIEVLHVDCLAWTSALDSQIDVAVLPRAVAPHLHTLVLVNNMCMGFNFFRLLDAPQLRHLAVDEFCRQYPNLESRSRIWMAVQDMLASSAVRLTSFYCAHSWQNIFLDIIRLDALQDVEELSFVNAPFDDALAGMLVLDDETRFLPRLEDLTLGTCGCRSCGTFDDMVMSRVGTLKVLDIHHLTNSYNRRVLEAAKARGLTLYLQNTP